MLSEHRHQGRRMGLFLGGLSRTQKLLHLQISNRKTLLQSLKHTSLARLQQVAGHEVTQVLSQQTYCFVCVWHTHSALLLDGRDG